MAPFWPGRDATVGAAIARVEQLQRLEQSTTSPGISWFCVVIW